MSQLDHEQHLLHELDVMKRLQRLAMRTLQKDDLVTVLTEIVDTAIAIAGADFGNIQLLDQADSRLRIVAQRGFPQWWLDYWESVGVGQGCCGMALEQDRRVIVEDIEKSPMFAGTLALEIQRRAGVRAVQSTPLISRTGQLIGMFSTHYGSPHCPDDRTLALLDILSSQAADLIAHSLDQQVLRQKEFQLQQATDLIDAVTSGTRVFIATIDSNYCYTFFNKTHQQELLRLTGKHTAIGMSLQEVLADMPAERDNALAIWGRALAGETITHTLEFGDQNRHRRWYRTRHTPIRDAHGTIIGAGEITEDISSFVEADRKLEIQGTILDKISDGVMVVSTADGRIVFNNPAFESMFGYADGELIGQHPAILYAATDKSPEEIANDIIRMLREHGVWNGNLLNRRKDGGTLWSHAVISSHELSPWGPVWLGIQRDISQHVRAETQRLMDLERQRDTLVREVHHRIKNHLEGITGLLRNRAADRPDISEPLSEAISQIQSVAQIYGLKGREDAGQIRLSDILRLATENLMHEVKVEYAAPPFDRQVSLKPTEEVPVALIVNELMTNAAKHLVQKDPDRFIHVNLNLGNAEARIEIRNAPARLPKGFDFVTGEGCSTGLELVRALLAPQGAMLEFLQEGNSVVALLRLSTPVIQ